MIDYHRVADQLTVESHLEVHQFICSQWNLGEWEVAKGNQRGMFAVSLWEGCWPPATDLLSVKMCTQSRVLSIFWFYFSFPQKTAFHMRIHFLKQITQKCNLWILSSQRLWKRYPSSYLFCLEFSVRPHCVVPSSCCEVFGNFRHSNISDLDLC